MHRESGFYWVKVKNYSDWTVGEYDTTPYSSGWIVVGCEMVYSDFNLSEIGEKIERIVCKCSVS